MKQKKQNVCLKYILVKLDLERSGLALVKRFILITSMLIIIITGVFVSYLGICMYDRKDGGNKSSNFIQNFTYSIADKTNDSLRRSQRSYDTESYNFSMSLLVVFAGNIATSIGLVVFVMVCQKRF
jgi:hypothetical protein